MRLLFIVLLLDAVAMLAFLHMAVSRHACTMTAALHFCRGLLQAVFAKQKESFIKQVTKAETAKQELQKQVHKLEEESVRVASLLSQRQQQAADKGEQLDQQLNSLRKVRCDGLLRARHAADSCSDRHCSQSDRG